jgi:hypothetical protein
MVESFEKWTPEEIREEYAWAVELVRKRFSDGLEGICEPKFLADRYQWFKTRDDPVYAELLAGMGDEALSQTFVSYWTVGQTLASQSRWWLDNAIADIIIHQVRNFGRAATKVYSQAMLSDGYLEVGRVVAEIGEGEREHLTSRAPWKPEIQDSALEAINVLVGQQELLAPPKKRKPFERQGRTPQEQERDLDLDVTHMKRVAESLKGPPASSILVNCNLLVVEPDRLDGKVHARAFRFVNPRVLGSHAQRKQERVNLLRLYAYLVQEKILRDPISIHVAVADVIPRYSTFPANDHYPLYFSPESYWHTNRLWDYIGVPFEVVRFGIHDVAKEFRNRLRKGLKDLLPTALNRKRPKTLFDEDCDS